MRRLFILFMVALFVSAGCGSDDGGNQGGFGIYDDTGLQRVDSGADAGPQQDALILGAAIGQPCSSDNDCRDGRCLSESPYTGGYCTTPDGCSVDADCPGESSCMSTPTGGVCAQRCDRDAQCRSGYLCSDSTSSSYDTCAPLGEVVSGKPDGDACQSDDQCAGGTCLGQEDGWPNGYCTTVFCETREDCARQGYDNRCLHGQQANLCVRMCDSQADCRDGYVCQQVGGGESFCAPDQSVDAGLDGIENNPFPVTCGLSARDGQIDVDYNIAADTVSYMLTPVARDGRELAPSQLNFPDGTRIGFSGEHAFQTIPAQLFGFINPMVYPAIEPFSDLVQGGAHTLELQTTSQDLCYYLLEEDSFGTTIDFNIYLVDVPGLDASNAASDPSMQAVLQRFDDIYAAAGVRIGDVSYHEVGESADQAYGIIRSETDLQELVSLSEKPEGGLDGVLSANVFFVRSMQLGGGGGSAIGISPGLPGAAALHGTPSSGVVFTSEYMGGDFPARDGSTIDGDELTGVVFAHEIGHYLGLFHTTEQYSRGFDPIADTPECRSGFPSRCPDLGNLMFPLADVTHTELTVGQSHTIKANPLTKD